MGAGRTRNDRLLKRPRTCLRGAFANSSDSGKGTVAVQYRAFARVITL